VLVPFGSAGAIQLTVELDDLRRSQPPKASVGIDLLEIRPRPDLTVVLNRRDDLTVDRATVTRPSVPPCSFHHQPAAADRCGIRAAAQPRRFVSCTLVHREMEGGQPAWFPAAGPGRLVRPTAQIEQARTSSESHHHWERRA